MIVVDANVVVYFTVESGFTDAARALAEIDSAWVVPTLCRYELSNVLASYVKTGRKSVAANFAGDGGPQTASKVW